MTLGADEVHVQYRTLDAEHEGRPGIGRDEYDDAWALLSPEERACACRFVFAADRERYVVSHALVRQILSQYSPLPPEAWQFVTNAYGKPMIAPGCQATGLRFNLSHTNGLMACAVARRPVGVDVEAIDRRVQGLDIAARFFSPMELEWLRAHSPDDQPARFIELWTLKEAYVKGIGKGLSCPLSSFGFGFGRDGSIRFHPPMDETATWHFTQHSPTSRHRLAVAATSSTKLVTSIHEVSS